ncbi:MAG: PQQ-like beta-propeller repeat protein, partial [Verrucomicrobiales bacterium]|nr:PQQ-like beta-propeller repeat protein [Verrucomicrobiales bacterium]
MRKLLLICLLVSSSTLPLSADNWPYWRGDIAGSGITTETDLPLNWGKDKNVKWRVELPERGNSTPVVWDDSIFVTQALDAENWRGLMCFHREDGKLLWKNGLTYSEEERTHRDNPYCSASPATDGSIVIASYGSAGVAAYDFEGKELWKRDFGAIDHTWGNSSSPIIFGDLCFHYHGPSKGAVLYALNKTSGETVWSWNEPDWKPENRTDGFREKADSGVIGSFSTPVLMKDGDKDILVMSFPLELKAFDPQTGNVLWTCEGLNPLVYTSPMVADGKIIAMGGYYGNSVGAASNGERLWREVRHFGGIGTGVVKDGYFYAQNSGGVVYCVEVATGKTVWKDRLPGAGKSWGSYILSGDLIYTLSQPGDTVVFKASPEKFEVVAQNNVGERTNSSLV